jgi:hypothetical protein
MKKTIYSALIALAVIVSVSSCTEENVTPAVKSTSNGGGAAIEANVG